MLLKYIEGEGSGEIQQDWINLEQIDPHLPLAVIASEDQNFFEHSGFDMEAIRDAIQYNKSHQKTRGASTISQQTAKNVFLIPSRSLFRKGLEAYFTLLIELVWSKERILEVYLNLMEQGENIYGAKASAMVHFGIDPSELNEGQAALMAAVLPNPIKFRIGSPSNYIRGRQQWIMGQMNNLGGISFVDRLYE